MTGIADDQRSGPTDAATRSDDAGRPSGRARRAIAAVGLGNAVEWYDFAVYGALATVIGAVFFPTSDPGTQLLLAFAVYGTALLVRPIGAIIFGRLGDLRGRRSAMTTVIVLMTGATAAVGLLPGYAAIGIAAPIVLVACRALQGLGAGGELGIASTFLFEHAPARRGGAVGSLQISTLALGAGAGMTVAAGLLLISGGAAESPLWRLAFLVALPLGLVGWYVRARVDETSAFLAVRTERDLSHARDPRTVHRSGAGRWSRGTPLPWRRLSSDRSSIGRGFAIMASGSLAFNVMFIFLPNHLVAVRGARLVPVWLISASALLVTAVAAAVLGRLSDRIGRRPVVLASAVALIVLAAPMAELAIRSPALLWLAQCTVGIAIGGVLSVALLAEAFPAERRASALALSAGLATALVGGTAPLVSQILIGLTGAASAPGWYVAAVGCSAFWSAWTWERARRTLPRRAEAF